jgi:hypothetical protein
LLFKIRDRGGEGEGGRGLLVISSRNEKDEIYQHVSNYRSVVIPTSKR